MSDVWDHVSDVWVDLLVDGPDVASAATVIRHLVDSLPDRSVHAGASPEAPADAPAPPRYLITAAVHGPGPADALRAEVTAALSEMSIVAFDYHEPLDLVVVRTH